MSFTSEQRWISPVASAGFRRWCMRHMSPATGATAFARFRLFVPVFFDNLSGSRSAGTCQAMDLPWFSGFGTCLIRSPGPRHYSQCGHRISSNFEDFDGPPQIARRFSVEARGMEVARMHFQCIAVSPDLV